MLNTGELANYPNFRRLLISRLFGGAASQMVMMAVGWQMYELTGSAWDLGLIGLFQFAPVLGLTLLAGHAADRFNRARIVACAVALQAVCTLVLLGATLSHSLSRELLIGMSIALGTATTFQRPAQGSLVGSIVPVHLLARAMALSASVFQAAVIAGPAIAGALFVLGGAYVYGIALGCLGLSLGLALRIDHVFTPLGSRAPTWESMLAGVRFVRANRVLLGAISLDLLAVLLGGATALLPIYAKDLLGVGAAGLGALRSAPAAGALVMSVLLSRWPIQSRVGSRLLGAVAVYGCCMLLFGVSRSFVLSLAVLAISGAADMVSVVVRQTLVQTLTPDDMRGRVGAVSSMFIGASNQLGEFESGATAALMGPVASVVLGGAGTLCIVALWYKVFPQLARQHSFEAR
ncbi:MFS transporter [Ramlibacter tataouinensis]|uniref:MFS transporter n=1 Tax=Ramlibacter tataouinensis TaxID=94132 RepID=UPI000AE2CDD5|nr:MFS transporter [Ramlibacter tataouinensis]